VVLEKDGEDRLDRSRKKGVLQRVKEKSDILGIIKQRKASWIGHTLRRNCLVKLVIERKIEGTGRLGGRRKQLLYDLKEKRRDWKLKEEALDRSLCRARFGTG
jgi:hypothetical protein